MTTCRECGREISERAPTCPGCGAPGPGAGLVIGGGGPVPGGVELASWGSRFGAWLLDGIIVFVPVLLLGLVLFSVSDSGVSTGDGVPAGAGLSMVSLFFLWLIASILYKPLMEGSKGQTLGKMAVGIKVIQVDGSRCDMAKAFLRWLVAAVAGVVPFGNIIDGLWPLWDPRKQALHDKVGTLVVRA